jgi:predicted GNAT family N-acyltransferase
METSFVGNEASPEQHLLERFDSSHSRTNRIQNLVQYIPPYIVDRATTYHDGKEPYIKLGRIAVVKEFRGAGVAKILANAAITWAQQNPTFFNPSVTSMGMEKMGATTLAEIPVWQGLVCAHAQEQVVPAWTKWGFKVDEGMGTWTEEGIKHVGMFQRLDIKNVAPEEISPHDPFSIL